MQREARCVRGIVAGPRAGDRLLRRHEHREHAVAQRLPLDRRPAVLANRRSHRLVQPARFVTEGVVAQPLRKHGGVDNVREEDDCCAGWKGRVPRLGRLLVGLLKESNYRSDVWLEVDQVGAYISRNRSDLRARNLAGVAQHSGFWTAHKKGGGSHERGQRLIIKMPVAFESFRTPLRSYGPAQRLRKARSEIAVLPAHHQVHEDLVGVLRILAHQWLDRFRKCANPWRVSQSPQDDQAREAVWVACCEEYRYRH